MAMEDAAWARPEELKKAESEAIKRALAGEINSENDFAAHYAYKIGANRELIKQHTGIRIRREFKFSPWDAGSRI